MSRAREAFDDLRRELIRAVVLETGTRENIAAQYADAILKCLQSRKAANGTVYIGAPVRQYNVLQIAAALERGDSPAKVQRMFGISKSKLHGLFPGGLPKPAMRA